MNLATLTWVTLAAVIFYLVTQDENVLPGLVLLSKSANIWVQRRWFMIRFHPESPWIRYKIYQNARKIAAQIIKENENR